MLPLAGDIAAASDISLMLPTLSAVLARRSVWRSRLTDFQHQYLVSNGAGSHHIDHVVTQLPYAISAAMGALLGYLAMGLLHSVWAGLAASSVWFVLFCAFNLRQKRWQQEPVEA